MVRAFLLLAALVAQRGSQWGFRLMAKEQGLDGEKWIGIAEGRERRGSS